jgi:hypothetical protein
MSIALSSTTSTAAATRSAIAAPSAVPGPATSADNPFGTHVVVDLSGLGAAASDPEADLPVDSADLPRLARHAHAFKSVGVTEVALSTEFHLRSDARWRTDSVHDATRTGERLTDAGVNVLLPGAPTPEPTLGGFVTASAARRPATRSAGRTRTAGGTATAATRTRVATYVNSVAEGEAAGRAGGTAIVRATHTARIQEFVAAVRRGAQAAGADTRVLVEVHVAIAETRERALARTELVADIASVENRDLPWTGSAAVIGSVEDVVEEAKAFGALGDGLLIVPISVPADLTAVHEIL